MPSREALYMYAGSVAASYRNLSNEDRADYLRYMYDETYPEGRKVNWTHDVGEGTNMDALLNGRWLRKNGKPGGTSVASEGTAWCGIFATLCLRAIGVPAQWTLEKGITTPPGVLELRSGYISSDDIGPGDICVEKENQHHFIVYRREGKMLYSYDGNLPGQMIAEGTPHNVDTLIAGVREQMQYDRSILGQLRPDRSKFSFHYYRLK